MATTDPEHASRLALDRLPPRARNAVYHAVIEAAQGSRNKCKFEPALGVLVLHKVLPPGLAYPYSFGFIPGTLGDDGDALDVLVLMDEPVVPGTVVPCRLVGVIEARQRKRGEKKTIRNDRLLAIALEGERYRSVRQLRALGREVLDDIERFFVADNERADKVFTPIGRRGRTHAETLVARGVRRYARDASG